VVRSNVAGQAGSIPVLQTAASDARRKRMALIRNNMLAAVFFGQRDEFVRR
jgi:hypothetical protein